LPLRTRFLLENVPEAATAEPVPTRSLLVTPASHP
jgi:hypothetical protein